MEIDKRFLQAISEQLGVPADAISPDEPLMGPALKADELDLVELTMAAENLFGGSISEDAVEARLGGEYDEVQWKITPRLLQELAQTGNENQTTAEDVGEESDLGKAFARTYGVELLFTTKPVIDRKKLHDAMKARCGNVEMGDTDDDGSVIMFFHVDHLITYREGKAPAQFVIMLPSEGKEGTGTYEAELQQSWDWPEAEDVVRGCTHSLLATDMMSSALPHVERVSLFMNALRALVETVPCRAIRFQITQQILSPQAFLASFDADRPNPPYGAINVRFFSIQGSDGDMLMDTVGLAAIGLCDLQCHFQELDPNEVARVILNTAAYVYENGDVIGDGHTVPGVNPDSKWQCQHEAALVPPARVVLDMDPGKSYAAGDR